MSDKVMWDGLLLRTSTSDDGNIPRPVTSDSPDIICSGSMPAPNPSQYVDAANYSNGYSNQIFNHISNYFYVRGKNTSEDTQSGYLHLYWTQSNLLLLPSLWAGNYMETSSGAQGVKVSAEKQGDIVANVDDAFSWTPTPPDPGQHYCLMAQCSDSIDPSVGIPSENFPSGVAWADWLSQQGNWAWRNTCYISTDSPDVKPTMHHIRTPGKESDPPCLYNIYIKCTNVPPGWAFQFSSGTVIPAVPGYDNPINTISKSKAAVTDPNDNIGAHWHLPAQFETDISVSVWMNNIPPNADTKWEFKINQVTNDASMQIYKRGMPLMIYKDPHPAILAWQERNAKLSGQDEPIGVEVECGSIDFLLVK